MRSPLWSIADVADRIGQSLAEAESALKLEQAVYGLDAMDERAMQTLLADRLAAFYTVAREIHYPSSRGAKLTHRQRCDLVLTPLGKPLAEEVKPFQPPTLFDAFAAEALGPRCLPDDALWLEVKVASQFREGGQRHGGYGAQWRQAVVDDLRKMDADQHIREAGLVLIVFNESDAILDKDLQLFEDVLARKEVLAGFRQVRSIPITERIGHRLCTAAVWPTIQR
ncbi:MAG TPA: hypothetical protein VHY57_07180 [Rhizomicrobium sp.]|nr:hypothetical protein [Rhizomicrobium sp.]